MPRISRLTNDQSRRELIVNFRKKVVANSCALYPIGRLCVVQFALDLGADMVYLILIFELLQQACSVAVRLIERKQQKSINQVVSIVIFLGLESRSGDHIAQSCSGLEIHTV